MLLMSNTGNIYNGVHEVCVRYIWLLIVWKSGLLLFARYQQGSSKVVLLWLLLCLFLLLVGVITAVEIVLQFSKVCNFTPLTALPSIMSSFSGPVSSTPPLKRAKLNGEDEVADDELPPLLMRRNSTADKLDTAAKNL
jgi:hypothetical protein